MSGEDDLSGRSDISGRQWYGVISLYTSIIEWSGSIGHTKFNKRAQTDTHPNSTTKLFWCACGVSWQVRQDVGLQALYFVRQWWYPETQAEGRRRPRDQRETPSTLGVGFYSYLKLDFVFRKLHVSSCDDHMLFMTWPVWPMYKEYI